MTDTNINVLCCVRVLNHWDTALQQLPGVALSQIIQSEWESLPYAVSTNLDQSSQVKRVYGVLLDYSVQLPTTVGRSII